jgi:hypothetical protein
MVDGNDIYGQATNISATIEKALLGRFYGGLGYKCHEPKVRGTPGAL